MQKLEANLELEKRTPEEIIHDKLSVQWRSTEFSDPELEGRRKDFFFGLNLGWEALAYERFELLSTAASISSCALSGYAQQYDRRTIEITPQQRKALAACAEVVGIPFDPDAGEIPIPENAFNLNERLLEEAERSHIRSIDKAGRQLPSPRDTPDKLGK